MMHAVFFIDILNRFSSNKAKNILINVNSISYLNIQEAIKRIFILDRIYKFDTFLLSPRYDSGINKSMLFN